MQTVNQWSYLGISCLLDFFGAWLGQICQSIPFVSSSIFNAEKLSQPGLCPFDRVSKQSQENLAALKLHWLWLAFGLNIGSCPFLSTDATRLRIPATGQPYQLTDQLGSVLEREKLLGILSIAYIDIPYFVQVRILLRWCMCEPMISVSRKVFQVVGLHRIS